MTAPDDAKTVLSALRLGWYLAEVRGRNRPGGPPGSTASMPDDIDHPLPLRVERSRDELRVEAQMAVAQLAKDLQVDDPGDGVSFGAVLADQANLLAHLRAPTASGGLQRALELFQMTSPERASPGTATPPTPGQAVHVLEEALVRQQAVVVIRQRAADRAEQALTAAQKRAAAAAQQRGEEQSTAEADRAAAQAALELEQATVAGEETGIAVLQESITGLQRAIAADPAGAAETGRALIRAGQQTLAAAVHRAWPDLAELIWKFDAHIQNRLTASSETQAWGYQLGRGLAETYWALDHWQSDGSHGDWVGWGCCVVVSVWLMGGEGRSGSCAVEV